MSFGKILKGIYNNKVIYNLKYFYSGVIFKQKYCKRVFKKIHSVPIYEKLRIYDKVIYLQ